MLPPGSPRPLPEIVFQMKFVAMDNITPTAKPTRANTVYGPAWRCVKLLVEALCNAAYEQFAAAGSITTPSRDAACNSSSCCNVALASGPVQLQLSPCNHHQVHNCKNRGVYSDSTCRSTVPRVKPGAGAGDGQGLQKAVVINAAFPTVAIRIRSHSDRPVLDSSGNNTT